MARRQASAAVIPNRPKSSNPTSDVREIEARHGVAPMQQGELDKLCGIYAVINAIRLAAEASTPLNMPACRTLFAAGVEFMTSLELLDEAAVDGISHKHWRRLVKRLIKSASDDRFEFSIERPARSDWTSVHHAFAWIDESLAQGKAVLLALDGKLKHYTVVAGSTPHALLLFDSTGLQFVHKSSCGLSNSYHVIVPKALMRVAMRRRR